MSLMSQKDNAESNELVKYMTEHTYFYGKSGYYEAAEKFLISAKFRDLADRIQTMEVYDDDTWLLTYPRSGAAWSREMIWLIANDMDFKGAEADLNLRFPLLELSCFFEDAHEVWQSSIGTEIGDSVDFVKQMPRPRFIWSHLPFELLPVQITEKELKIITISREPKDTATSLYHLYRCLEGYNGNTDTFFEAFRKGLCMMGCYWHHFASIQKLRSQLNFISYTYEEMNKDLISILKKITNFYKKELTDEDIKILSAHLSISNMKTNEAVNFRTITDMMQNTHKRPVSDADFIRKGIVGDHRNYMSEEGIQKFDEWNREMKIKLNLADNEGSGY